MAKAKRRIAGLPALGMLAGVFALYGFAPHCFCAVRTPAAATTRGTVAHGKWYGIQLPGGARNFALRSAGAYASASSTASGFDANGVIDGDWSARNWGKGHGWQSAKRHEYPVTLDVRLREAQEIDTIIVETYPAAAHEVNWMGVRNFDIEVEHDTHWAKVATIRANREGLVTVRVPALTVSAVRLTILAINNAGQEDNFYDDDDFARILQLGVYRLRIPTPAPGEDISVSVESGPRGNAAIYRDQLPVDTPHASSPEYLASVFRKAGYGVTFLNSKALCVPGILDARNFDVFIDPYGAPFPAGSQLLKFLAKGGHLITLGGRPFRRALMFSPEGKLIDGGFDPGLTTAVNRVSDYSLTYREQLGMFYNGYQRLEDVTVAKTAPDQMVVHTVVNASGTYSGEVAAAVVGDRWSLDETRQMVVDGTFPEYVQNAREGIATVTALENAIASSNGFDSKYGLTFHWPRSRWIPLINGYDRYGKLRGSLLSLVRNYHLPYRGSSWIFSGVSNQDLFTAEHPEFAAALIEALEYSREPVFLHDPQPALDSFRDGEAAEVAATIENIGATREPVRLRCGFIDSRTGRTVFEKTVPVDAGSDPYRRISVAWKPDRFESDLYRVRMTLFRGDRPVDGTETGFVVWKPEVLAQGPKVEFRDSYFLVDGRRELLIGARTAGIYPHGELDEDVIGWDRQFSMMRDFGMKVASPVFFSMYVPGLAWGKANDGELIPEQLLRAMDAQLQLAQKHHLVFAPCLFFTAKLMAMENHDLARKICELLARRYASVPGLMYYIFDDGPPELSAEEFRSFAEVCARALASAGRQYIVMGETAGTALQRYGSAPLTFPSNGTYTPGVPSMYKLMDMRMAGKSFHNSEFGVNSPGARPGEFDPNGPGPSFVVSGSPTGDYAAYLMEPHLLFASGGAFILNWCWKDPGQLLFPWGVTNPNDFTPKYPLFAYRNNSFFLRHFEPEFRPPTALVVFSRERLIRDEKAYEPYLRAIIDVLVDNNIQFAVVDDSDLGKIPEGARILIYPGPHYASRQAFATLLARVRAGDKLFLSGDFTQPLKEGEARQTGLFEEIAGVSWHGAPEAGTVSIRTASGMLAPYIGSAVGLLRATDANVLAADQNGNAVVTDRKMGAGVVFYTADPAPEGGRRALDAFLRLHSAPSLAITPRMPHRPIFAIDRVGGGKIFTLLATRPEGDLKSRWNGPWIDAPESYLLDSTAASIRIPLGTYGVSLIALGADGQVDALEGQGRFESAGSVLLDSEPHGMLMSLDKKPLNRSDALAFFALGAGDVALHVNEGQFVVQAGEFRGEAFEPLEPIPAKAENGMLRFHIDPVQSRFIFLIARQSSIEQARMLMTEALK